MKNCIFFLSIVMGLLTGKGFAVNPIPSYGVLVHEYANFQEQSKSFGTGKLDRGKKTMVVRSICGGTKDQCNCTVWVYTLDGQTVLGPFYLVGSDIVYVDIDEREWGVLVQSNDKVVIDVWIEESKSPADLGIIETFFIKEILEKSHS